MERPGLMPTVVACVVVAYFALHHLVLLHFVYVQPGCDYIGLDRLC